jgi:transaldolase/glucose-6-phosphate isomerase
MPLETIEAWRDHGRVETTLTPDNHKRYEAVLGELKAVGVDLDDICLNTLVVEGVKKFADSFTELLQAVEKNVHQLQHS